MAWLPRIWQMMWLYIELDSKDMVNDPNPRIRSRLFWFESMNNSVKIINLALTTRSWNILPVRQMLTELTRAQVFNALKIKWICNKKLKMHNLRGSISQLFISQINLHPLLSLHKFSINQYQLQHFSRVM